MKYRRLIFPLILAIITSPILLRWSQYSLPASELPITVDDYEPIHLTSNFQTLWSKPDAYAYYADESVMLAATEQSLIFLGSLAQDEPESLISLNASTGDIEWVKLDDSQSSDGIKSTVLANDQLIYVVFGSIWRVPGDATFGAIKIRAYHPESGHLTWSRPVKGADSIASLMLTNTTISVDGNSSKNYYLFDAQTGQIVETLNKKNTDFLWFTEKGISYEKTRLHSFQAIDQKTDNLVWQSPFLAIYHPPILSGGILFIRSGTSTSVGAIYALDSVTGDTLWEHAGVVSNVVVQNSVAYFLTSNGKLLAVSHRTGDILGFVEFDPDRFILHDDNLFLHGFSVAAIGNIVAVHFGDSQQLVAFHFSLDG